MLVNTTYWAFQNAGKSLHREVLQTLFSQAMYLLKDRRKNKNGWLGSRVKKAADGVVQTYTVF